ncbi:hypothetical protein [Granulicella arctica]|uniref:hypothetical protein n=1 Tax=Granulicella arctica TaxID=940613 RepID=UPI0021DFDEB3|nr:hypothetical protein [Granulicella arctica]
MNSPTAPRVVSAERLNGGVMIIFADGKGAVYSATLLYAMFGQALEVEAEPEQD